MKIPLKNVSLVAVASTHHIATIKALKYSSKFIEFGKILFFSEINPSPRENFFKYVKTEFFGTCVFLVINMLDIRSFLDVEDA